MFTMLNYSVRVYAPYGRHSPVCVLCTKIVIFWGTLRHFCGNFKNGIIKTETFFLDKFVGRVRIWNKICRKVYYRLPWGAGGQGSTF